MKDWGRHFFRHVHVAELDGIRAEFCSSWKPGHPKGRREMFAEGLRALGRAGAVTEGGFPVMTVDGEHFDCYRPTGTDLLRHELAMYERG